MCRAFFVLTSCLLGSVGELVGIFFEFVFAFLRAEIGRLPAFIRFEFAGLVDFHSADWIDVHNSSSLSDDARLDSRSARRDGRSWLALFVLAPECVLEVGQQILGMFESNGKPQQVLRRL